MSKKTNVEVEGGELLLRSDEGHYAVIPSKDRNKIKKFLEKGDDKAINNYISNLPKESDYAQDGSIYSMDNNGGDEEDGKKDKWKEGNTIYTTDPNDPDLKAYSDSLQAFNRAKKLSSHLEKKFPENGRQVLKEIGYSSEDIERKMPKEGEILMDAERLDADKKQNLSPKHKNLVNHLSYFPISPAEKTENIYTLKKPTQPVKYADPEIVEKQKKLKEAGLYEGRLDGIWGPKSKKAWKKLQKEEDGKEGENKKMKKEGENKKMKKEGPVPKNTKPELKEGEKRIPHPSRHNVTVIEVDGEPKYYENLVGDRIPYDQEEQITREWMNKGKNN